MDYTKVEVNVNPTIRVGDAEVITFQDYSANDAYAQVVETEGEKLKRFASTINEFCDYVHTQNVKAGWWTGENGEDLRGTVNDTGLFSDAKRDLLNLLMLAVTELAEAAEGVRKNCADDKLPHRKMFPVELGDTVIRIGDMAGAHKLDLGNAIIEKLVYNQTRLDHKPEERKKAGGKKF